MSQIFEKFLEAVTLTDPATVTQGQAQTAIVNYQYNAAFVPKVGYGNLTGLIQNVPFNPGGLAVASITPTGPNVIINNNSTAFLSITVANVITVPNGALTGLSLGVGAYGTCTIPKEWWTPTSTINIAQTLTPSTSPSSLTTVLPYATVTNVDIFWWN